VQSSIQKVTTNKPTPKIINYILVRQSINNPDFLWCRN